MDDRAEFEAYWRERCLKSFPKDYDMERLSGWGADYKPDAHKAWQAATQRQQERIAYVEKVADDAIELGNQQAIRIAELEAQVQALSLDAGRLDYLQRHARSDPKMDGNHVWWPTSFNQAQNLTGPTLREAIDAAIDVGKGGQE